MIQNGAGLTLPFMTGLKQLGCSLIVGLLSGMFSSLDTMQSDDGVLASADSREQSEFIACILELPSCALCSIISWPKDFYLSDVCVSPILMVG